MGIDSYFPSPATGESAITPVMHNYTHGVSTDISHGRIRVAVNVNFVEVAGSSESARTLATRDHLDSIRTAIPSLIYCVLLFECHTETVPGFHPNNCQW